MSNVVRTYLFRATKEFYIEVKFYLNREHLLQAHNSLIDIKVKEIIHCLLVLRIR